MRPAKRARQLMVAFEINRPALELRIAQLLRKARNDALEEAQRAVKVDTARVATAAVFAQLCEHIDQRLLANDGPAGDPGAFFREMRDDEAATLYRCADAIRETPINPQDTIRALRDEEAK